MIVARCQVCQPPLGKGSAPTAQKVCGQLPGPDKDSLRRQCPFLGQRRWVDLTPTRRYLP